MVITIRLTVSVCAFRNDVKMTMLQCTKTWYSDHHDTASVNEKSLFIICCKSQHLRRKVSWCLKLSVSCYCSSKVTGFEVISTDLLFHMFMISHNIKHQIKEKQPCGKWVVTYRRKNKVPVQALGNLISIPRAKVWCVIG